MNMVLISVIDPSAGRVMSTLACKFGEMAQFQLPPGSALDSIAVQIGDPWERLPELLSRMEDYLESDHERHPPGQCVLCDDERSQLREKMTAVRGGP